MLLLATRFLKNSLLFKRVDFLSGITTIGGGSHFFHQTDRSFATKCPTEEITTFKTRMAMPKDHDNILSFMCDTFYKYEPVYRYLGLHEEPTAASLMKSMLDNIRQGMTIIAQTKDKRIIGAAVNIGICPFESERWVEYAQHCESGPVQDIIEFFAYVTRKPNLWERYCVGKIFECNSIAVDPGFQGLGIGRKLMQDSWYLARDCGYRLFRIDCTSNYTAKAAEDFGWECVCTIPYRRYIKNGRQVFQNVEENSEVRIYIDRLFRCKDYCLLEEECKIVTSEPKSSTEIKKKK